MSEMRLVRGVTPDNMAERVDGIPFQVIPECVAGIGGCGATRVCVISCAPDNIKAVEKVVEDVLTEGRENQQSSHAVAVKVLDALALTVFNPSRAGG